MLSFVEVRPPEEPSGQAVTRALISRFDHFHAVDTLALRFPVCPESSSASQQRRGGRFSGAQLLVGTASITTRIAIFDQNFHK